MGNTEETAAEETLEREGASNAGRGDMEPAREVQAPDGCPSPLEIRPYDPSADSDADYGANPRPMFKVNDYASAHLADGIDPNGYYMNTWD